MIARAEESHERLVRERGGNGVESAAEGFPDQQHVGFDAVEIAGKEVAGASESGLNFVGDEEHLVLATQRPGALEVAFGRHVHAALTLNRLDQYRARIRV